MVHVYIKRDFIMGHINTKPRKKQTRARKEQSAEIVWVCVCVRGCIIYENEINEDDLIKRPNAIPSVCIFIISHSAERCSKWQMITARQISQNPKHSKYNSYAVSCVCVRLQSLCVCRLMYGCMGATRHTEEMCAWWRERKNPRRFIHFSVQQMIFRMNDGDAVIACVRIRPSSKSAARSEYR